jgi:hypothetical protein
MVYILRKYGSMDVLKAHDTFSHTSAGRVPTMVQCGVDFGPVLFGFSCVFTTQGKSTFLVVGGALSATVHLELHLKYYQQWFTTS